VGGAVAVDQPRPGDDLPVAVLRVTDGFDEERGQALVTGSWGVVHGLLNYGA
jgi:hypothetical protein